MLRLLFFCVAFVTSRAQVAGPVVTITSGEIQGEIVATHYGINVHSFQGIPYGRPPIGELRFEVSFSLSTNISVF